VQSTTSELSDVHSNRANQESVGNGKFMHANGILEAQINILPTMELTNSLPYDMEVGA
jgi:type IV secretory pathway VirB10-like protein